MDLNEVCRQMEACFGEQLKSKYFAVLRQWVSYKFTLNKEEFDSEVRKLLTTSAQIRVHNLLMLALYCPSEPVKTILDKGPFEVAEFSQYVQSSPSFINSTNFEYRTASNELFLPDSTFIAARIAIALSENGLHGAEHHVIEVLLHACQSFLKNIITAMASRKKGYKIRDRKLQYGFNLPIPDPFLRNYANLVDRGQKSKVDVLENEDTFIPKIRPSLEIAEQQNAFAYACSKRRKCDNRLTVRLLYETIRDDPRILVFHEMQKLSLLKLSLQIEDDVK